MLTCDACISYLGSAEYKNNACPFCKEAFVKDEMLSFITEFISTIHDSVERQSNKSRSGSSPTTAGHEDQASSIENGIVDLFEFWQIYEYQYLHRYALYHECIICIV